MCVVFFSRRRMRAVIGGVSALAVRGFRMFDEDPAGSVDESAVADDENVPRYGAQIRTRRIRLKEPDLSTKRSDTINR